MYDSCLSRAALLLSTNSTEDGSSIPTFTLVIPVHEENHRRKLKQNKTRMNLHIHLNKKNRSSLTYNTFLRRWWNNEALQRLLDRQLLKQTQEVAVAPPHREGLALKHGQGRLRKHDDGGRKTYDGKWIIHINRTGLTGSFVTHVKIHGENASLILHTLVDTL